MGSQQSSPGGSQIVYSNETPIQFSKDVINHLTDTRDSPNPAPERQQALDAVVQQRIQSEMKRLQEAEALVQADIEAALERENLDREKQVVDSSGGSSEELRNELEEVQKRADRFKSRLALEHAPEVKESQAKLLACYRNNPDRPLDCWEEVEHFKEAVSKLEKASVDAITMPYEKLTGTRYPPGLCQVATIDSVSIHPFLVTVMNTR
ncbi:hypothetical protein FRC11_012990 [Ceratobasidium sp. 423]|nr:hypothetical protein FRC11_012990 [Ceratobasidium sp. 423]